MAEEGKTILIVDDEEEIRENLFDFLEYKGFTPLEAEHGLDALQKLQEYTPDLILSDLMMPHMGGMDFLRALKERKIDIPVVIMTAFGTVEYAIDAMKNGAVDFLTKPIDLPYTMQVIDRVIQRSELERKVREQQRQMEEDLSHAAMIQRCLLPDPIETDFVSLQYRFEPLIEIGGDYLTVHKYHDKKVAAALYDVSGHGVSAALTGSLIHNQLMMSLEEERSGPAEILDALNKTIIHRIGKTGMFITIILALIDLDTYTMTVSNAGHPDLLIWRQASGELDAVSSNIPPVGMTLHMLGENNETTVPLHAGDRLVFYTDGFIETMDRHGTMIGKEGLRSMILSHMPSAMDDFIQKMFDALGEHHRGEPDDDLTLLVADIR